MYQHWFTSSCSAPKSTGSGSAPNYTGGLCIWAMLPSPPPAPDSAPAWIVLFPFQFHCVSGCFIVYVSDCVFVTFLSIRLFSTYCHLGFFLLGFCTYFLSGFPSNYLGYLFQVFCYLPCLILSLSSSFFFHNVMNFEFKQKKKI